MAAMARRVIDSSLRKHTQGRPFHYIDSMKRLFLSIPVCSLGGRNSEKRRAQMDDEGPRARERGDNIGDKYRVSASSKK